MKKTVLFITGLTACFRLLGQGTIAIANDDNQPVLYIPPGLNSPTELAPTNAGVYVQVFYQPKVNNTTPVAEPGSLGAEGWEVLTAPIPMTFPGLFFGSTATTGTDVAAGSSVWLFVDGWGGNFSSMDQAILAGAPFGTSRVWANPTGGAGNPPDAPASMVDGSAGFVTFYIVQPIPEPGTVTLFTLGGALLLLLNRRHRRPGMS